MKEARFVCSCRLAAGTGMTVILLAAYARADVPGYDLTEAMVPMRDGVKLHTVVYRPKKQDGPLPIMLLRTPYGVDLGAPRAGRVPEGHGRRRLHLCLPGHPRPVQVRGDRSS